MAAMRIADALLRRQRLLLSFACAAQSSHTARGLVRLQQTLPADSSFLFGNLSRRYHLSRYSSSLPKWTFSRTAAVGDKHKKNNISSFLLVVKHGARQMQHGGFFVSFCQLIKMWVLYVIIKSLHVCVFSNYHMFWGLQPGAAETRASLSWPQWSRLHHSTSFSCIFFLPEHWFICSYRLFKLRHLPCRAVLASQ